MVPTFTPKAQQALQELEAKGYRVTGYCFERQMHTRQPHRGFLDFGGYLSWHNAELAQLVRLQREYIEVIPAEVAATLPAMPGFDYDWAAAVEAAAAEQAQPTPIRKAALDLYVPPFTFHHGYIFDANNQMVADNDDKGTVLARVRGWGRIQYLDKPEQRAEQLQDEVGHMLAEALNDYWRKHATGQQTTG